MQKIIPLGTLFLAFAFFANGQNLSPKEKAIALLQNEFSKT
jgi:hypothetical protein